MAWCDGLCGASPAVGRSRPLDRLVKSFIDSAHFAGISYQAANWIRIGRTQGRGRQDRNLRWRFPAFVRLLRRYYAAVRLPAAVHVGLIAQRFLPPAAISR